ncbi:MAG: hypothetical protein GXY83_13110 [Rhodopirellula sp.]|nr:hypothetical protein [Rhodopirellula sp.]
MSESCRSLSLMVFAAVSLGWLTGCQVLTTPQLDQYDATLDQPVPPSMSPPRELEKVSLPAYRVEPPDVIQIEVLKVVPLPPYRLEVYDVMQIDVTGTLLDQPINNPYIIDAEGTVNLGPAYGSVRVAGMSIDEANEAIRRHLLQILKRPVVSVRLIQTTGMQPVSGIYLVGPDGTINLRQYGQVHVAGLSLPEIKVKLQRHLSQYLDSPEASVDVVAYNSKVYYIVTEGAGVGDNVVRVPITGNETVLDAISQIRGLSQLSSQKIWIARPAPHGFHCEQILPVDWNAITEGGSASTNYQILPGDRVFIAEDKMMTLTNVVAKIVGPFERAMGFSSLSVSTIRNFQSLGQGLDNGF